MLQTQASYLVYELAGAAMDSMTLSHDWEWRPGLLGARFEADFYTGFRVSRCPVSGFRV